MPCLLQCAGAASVTPPGSSQGFHREQNVCVGYTYIYVNKGPKEFKAVIEMDLFLRALVCILELCSVPPVSPHAPVKSLEVTLVSSACLCLSRGLQPALQ